MELSISIKNLPELRKQLKDFSERRFSAAVATALTRTAVKVREAALQEAKAKMDNPTDYTLRQLRYVPATAKRLVSAVGFNVVAITDQMGNPLRYQDLGPAQTPAGKYLQAQITGGPRRNKRFEVALSKVGILPPGYFAVPGERADVNSNGNQNVGEIRQILSFFGAAGFNAGSSQNMTPETKAKRLKGTKKKAGFDYFVASPGDVRQFTRANGTKGSKKMQPGIYRRTYLAMGTRIEPIIIFVRFAQYKLRYDFESVTTSASDRLLPIELKKAFDESAARMGKASS